MLLYPEGFYFNNVLWPGDSDHRMRNSDLLAKEYVDTFFSVGSKDKRKINYFFYFFFKEYSNTSYYLWINSTPD